MMPEAFLRVLVVALGLLVCPQDDPGVEEWEDIVTTSNQKPEERLLRGDEELNQVKSSVSNKGPQDGLDDFPEEEQRKSDQHPAEKDKMLDLKITEQESEEDNADHSLPEGQFTNKPGSSLSEKHDSELETDMKTSQITHVQSGKDILTESSAEEPGRPQDKDRKPKEVETSQQQDSPPSHVDTKTTENETSEKAASGWERDYLWYIWNTFSVLSMIRFFRKYLTRNSHTNIKGTRSLPMICTAAEVSLPDVKTLLQFHAKCVQVSSEKKWREDEFLEGFANDLLDAMKTICDKDGSMVIEGVQMVNTCDIIVHFTPPEPYRFQCLLWNNRASDLLLEMQVCGQIKLVEHEKIQNDCPCQSSDADDDMVCLLHCETEKVKAKTADACDGPLCSKNTPFLSKSQVTRWFQSTIRQAWALISHKYEFELNIRYIEGPGALVIRFRSGKMISFSMNPVVKYHTDAHFFISPWSSKEFDTFWTLSLTSYEKQLLEYLSKRLPENSCHNQTLEIALFLHKRQMAFSGSTALKDFHFKTALMHLLLSTKPSQWEEKCVVSRLRDLLVFLERSLEKKLLNHVLIGNPLTEVIGVSREFTKAKMVNLFHPLVVHNCIYKNAVMHFQEMLRNAHMLIHDYVVQCCNIPSSST
ncbi:inositol 1,4,5-trisphosphate receptor-interacting protein [Melanotaenia boesemani]|uniref:inositol 1,4,5-trisphosphate receptor-interacting protein n=1 Tax=Melanotaenia boesemani TaxID=1250792 RepID=UPI001C05BEB4|nr:inositol 1,4,5-trisphosphate receptor-interacting protein [Melanotaenia boesemani]